MNLLSLQIGGERDLVLARQRTRQVATLLGFDAQEATRLATAVSEVVRNAWEYARGGRVTFSIMGGKAPQRVVVEVADQGPGIPHLAEVLNGRYRSPTGLGLGLTGARRLVDHFEIAAAPGAGTQVRLGKHLPRHDPPLDAPALASLADQLIADRPPEPAEEVQRQNRELLQALEEVRLRQEDLERLNRELEDTNRGVVALYAELEERADELRRANRLQQQFLSYVSHEFRTPLDSMLALTGLLLDRADGPLTGEQETQVKFMRTSARDLLQMVDDLLDTARVEAGRLAVRPDWFAVPDVFNALRAMLRPLHTRKTVALVLEETGELPVLCTDEPKLSQVLRNLVSNALKFTEAGEVRVSASLEDGDARVVFRVSDTGIGIAPEDQDRIFQDFTQVDSAVQRNLRGMGLGLPLSRRFAELLGGELTLRSIPGEGSEFMLRVPRIHAECPDAGAERVA